MMSGNAPLIPENSNLAASIWSKLAYFDGIISGCSLKLVKNRLMTATERYIEQMTPKVLLKRSEFRSRGSDIGKRII